MGRRGADGGRRLERPSPVDHVGHPGRAVHTRRRPRRVRGNAVRARVAPAESDGPPHRALGLAPGRRRRLGDDLGRGPVVRAARSAPPAGRGPGSAGRGQPHGALGAHAGAELDEQELVPLPVRSARRPRRRADGGPGRCRLARRGLFRVRTGAAHDYRLGGSRSTSAPGGRAANSSTPERANACGPTSSWATTACGASNTSTTDPRPQPSHVTNSAPPQARTRPRRGRHVTNSRPPEGADRRMTVPFPRTASSGLASVSQHVSALPRPAAVPWAA